jgi:hypothetical protein
MPSLKDVTRIVINRIAVWETDGTCDDENPEVWRKIAGGPGFNIDEAAGTRRATKTFGEMRAKITAILSRPQWVLLFSNRDVEIFREETAYRWWKSGTTLNIVQRLYGKQLLIADMDRIARTGTFIPWDQAKKELGIRGGDH